MPAAILTAALLCLYFRFSTASDVYGTAGSLVILLIWIYWTGMILFFGTAFSCAWTKLFGTNPELEKDPSLPKEAASVS